MTVGAGYRVRVPAFSGPMDLLLHLVREREMEIADIPIGPIAEDFLAHVRAMPELDMEEASAFLVMAATLMEIKVRLLLPQEADGGSGEDPRWELVQKLLEYRRYKDAAAFLEGRGGIADMRRARPSPSEQDLDSLGSGDLPDAPGSGLPWTLFQAYARLETQLAPPRAATIRETEVPLERFLAEVLARSAAPEGPFRILPSELGRDRGRLVGLFLAVLELSKLGQIRARQETLFGPIVCECAPITEPSAN